MTSASHLDLTFAALADPTRRAIVARLAKGEATVMELARPFDMSQPAVSQHLKVLERAGLVRARREGTRRIYQVEVRGLDELRRYLEGFWDDALAAFKREAERTGKKGRSDVER